MIRGIPADEYPEVTKRVHRFLDNFASRDLDGETASDLEAAILDRRKQLWVIGDFQAVCITALTNEAVRIERCAGVRRHEWQEDLDAVLRAWAQSLGKKRIVATVRPGWSRFGKAQGYREAHREMTLEL